MGDFILSPYRSVAEVDAAAHHLPHPPEWNHPRGTQPLEAQRRQEIPGRRGIDNDQNVALAYR